MEGGAVAVPELHGAGGELHAVRGEPIDLPRAPGGGNAKQHGAGGSVLSVRDRDQSRDQPGKRAEHRDGGEHREGLHRSVPPRVFAVGYTRETVAEHLA